MNLVPLGGTSAERVQSMADENGGIFSQSGLSEAEAKEVQGYMMQYFMLFLAFAIVAHMLMWIYKPWFSGDEMGAMVTPVAQAISTFVV
ncbi:MAG: light-harvesting protein [Myxococcota bacterium]